jgi:thioredoxin-dependent peroxiredoxin
MAFPKIGNLAPAFSLKNQDGETVSLKDFKGEKNVVLYFYPKASTPGCTTQACGLRDTMADLKALDVVVLGVSPDQPPALQKFINKQSLNFDLLSDPDHAVADKYGAWGPKKFMGREYDGILRTSFLIDKEGKLRHILEKVKTKTHDQDVLTYVREHF